MSNKKKKLTDDEQYDRLDRQRKFNQFWGIAVALFFLVLVIVLIVLEAMGYVDLPMSFWRLL